MKIKKQFKEKRVNDRLLRRRGTRKNILQCPNPIAATGGDVPPSGKMMGDAIHGTAVAEASARDERKVERAIPVDAKDGLMGCKYSPSDKAVLVVYSPGSMSEVKMATSAFKDMGWEVKQSKYRSYIVLAVSIDGKVVSEGSHDDDGSELVNSDEDGDKLFWIGLWWGSGYMLDTYRAYGFDGEDALNKVVAYIERKHPECLSESDMIANDWLQELEEDGVEEPYEDQGFQETFLYVDATSEGADEPHYIWNENLRIERI